MDPLIDGLRTLDPAAPPPRLDLDTVIAHGLRRRAHARLATAAGAAVLAVLLVAAVGAVLALRPDPPAMTVAPNCAALLPFRPPGSAARVPARTPPTAAPAPGAHLPSEPPEAGVIRLTAALRAALHTALPGALTVTGGTCDEDWSMDALGGGYAANLDVYDASGLQHLSVALLPEPPPADDACLQRPRNSTCVRSVLDDGTVVYDRVEIFSAPALTTSVQAWRPDGTEVRVSLDNYTVDQSRPDVVPSHALTRPGPSLSLGELRDVALNPALTLFP
ncbi:hypothetical protein [Dactylosporangium sp. CA-092794]|uniref:hypothetical protein n=1 Tax=Dactylosporangium sp. CA-092794 TaxID=3239929 RepID=UPI003D8B1E0D